MNSSHTSPPPADAATAKAQYRIVRIYLKNASIEVPDMPNVPRQAITPHVGVNMQTMANPAGVGMLECVLRIALHARLEGKTIFLVEVSVAGVFELDISNMEDAQRFVRKIAPSVLFPFARRDLASLSIAAGFQPVLLDHIDFDAMLEQVIASQRLTRQPTPMPMRLDVIAAKPALAPVVALGLGDVPAVKVVPVNELAAPAQIPTPKEKTAHARDQVQGKLHDTQPLPLSSLSAMTEIHMLPESFFTSAPYTKMTPMPGSGNAKQARSKRRARSVALVVLGFATLGASVAWLIQREPVADPVAALKPTTVQNVKMSPETERAVLISRARLADQAADWFTLDMGTAAAEVPFSSSFPIHLLLQDRPAFVLKGKNDSLRFLYGVFPSKEAAERVRSQLLVIDNIKPKSALPIMPIGNFYNKTCCSPTNTRDSSYVLFCIYK